MMYIVFQAIVKINDLAIKKSCGVFHLPFFVYINDEYNQFSNCL